MNATQEKAVSAVRFAAFVLPRCALERRDLTDDDVRRIRELGALGTISQTRIGLMFGISQPRVSDILLRKTFNTMTLAETEAEVERISSPGHHSREDDREKLLECIETMLSLLQAPPNAIHPLTHDARRRAETTLAKAALELEQINPPAP